MAANRCRVCGRYFRPDPRKRGWNKQRTCGRDSCRQEQSRRKYQDWIKRHPGYQASRRLKVRGWAAAYPNYWRQYRRGHRQYTDRDNQRRLASKKRSQRSAKQTVRRGILVEKLLAVKGFRAGGSAKQTVIARRVDALVDVLIWREGSAKQSLIGGRAGPGG
jgi:hypothetical protein